MAGPAAGTCSGRCIELCCLQPPVQDRQVQRWYCELFFRSEAVLDEEQRLLIIRRAPGRGGQGGHSRLVGLLSCSRVPLSSDNSSS